MMVLTPRRSPGPTWPRCAPREAHGRRARRFGPALHLHETVARVDAHGQFVAVFLRQRRQFVRALQRARAEDGAAHAAGQQRIDVRVRPQPPAAFDGDARRGRHPADHVEMDRVALERAIEIHHVEPRRALRRPSAGLRGRIVAIHRRVVRAPLAQAHALAALEIHRRQNRECVHRSYSRLQSTKFFSMRKPACWLFSGWNCAATVRPRQTREVYSTP